MWDSGESHAASVGVLTTSAPSARKAASFSYSEYSEYMYRSIRKKHTYERHFVRHRDNHGISLICSIQHRVAAGRAMGVMTLTAQAIASPIPVILSQRCEHHERHSICAPVLPEVGSITTLNPGLSRPSFSAASTIRFAILSFTDPPADMYSTFPTFHPNH